MGENSCTVVHDERVDGPEEYSDERHGDGTPDEGGHKPNHKFKPFIGYLTLLSVNDSRKTYAIAMAVYRKIALRSPI